MTADPHSHLPKPEPYQRPGSGDGERKALLTRQIAFEPLPASVLFGLVSPVDFSRVLMRWISGMSWGVLLLWNLGPVCDKCGWSISKQES